MAKKEEKIKDVKKKNVVKKKKDKYESQFKGIFIILVAILVLVLLFILINMTGKQFKYRGLDFYKETEGSILYYKSQLGFVTVSGQSVPFILKLRNDPRKVANIPIEGGIKLKNKVILSISPELSNCSDTYITLIDFSRTLKAFGIEASAATIDEEYSKENKIPYINCRDGGEDETVIILKSGQENKITEEKNTEESFIITGAGDTTKITPSLECYTLEIKDCQVQQSFERFILEFILESMGK